MNIRKYYQLQKLGFDQDWLDDVKMRFKPKKRGKYEIKIYDIEDLDQEPETGIWLDTTCFSTALGLAFVHYFFEGNAYVLRLVETGEIIGKGILDDLLFEELFEDDFDGYEAWECVSRDSIKQTIAQQKAIEDAKPTHYIRKRRNHKKESV